LTIDPKNLAGTATLTFSDEFNSFNTWNGSSGWDTKWYYNPVEGGMGYNNELQWYINEGYAPTDAVNPWAVSSGVLDITAQKTDAAIKASVGGAAYTSGMINSYHDFSQQYGYFEMRADLPAGKGLWPAFWLLRQDGKMSSEIDIMEQIGHQPSLWYSSVHSFASGGIKSVSGTHSGTDTSAGFHTYGMNWTAQKLEFYQDGVKFWEMATPSDMNVPMYMIANLAVGGTWPGSPDSNTQFPSQMHIDYIRVYEDGPRSTHPNPPPNPTPTDPVPIPGNLFDLPVSGAPTKTISGSLYNNTLNGTSGKDLIDGKGGSDKMIGLAGDDTYMVSSTGDRVVETAGQGIDTVLSTASSHTLGSYVENLTLKGTTTQTGTGNSLDNILTSNDARGIMNGGAGHDILVAGKGNDLLTGGLGADTFVFNFAAVTKEGTYRHVTDFKVGEDKIDLHSLFTGYTGVDPLADGYMKFMTNPQGGMDIYVDKDGEGGAAPILVTAIDKVAISTLHLQSDIVWQ
jgi:beta-glucanase (GH16 family)